ELVNGGEAPLWSALSSQLIAEQGGNARLPLDGVVIVRTAEPQQGKTARFLRGLYNGLGAAAVLVGAEQSGQVNSAPAMYRRSGPRRLGGCSSSMPTSAAIRGRCSRAPPTSRSPRSRAAGAAASGSRSAPDGH